LSNPVSTSARTAAATGLEDNIDDLHDENHQPVNGAAAGSMRPPLPRPSSAAGAAAAGGGGGGGLRQTGLREMFAAPTHPTKSGGLALTASSPAASAASRGGRAGRGAARSSRAGAGRGRGAKAGSSQAGKRKRKAAVVEEEEDEEDEDDEDMEAELAAALEEGISEDEEEAPPASKRAKGESWSSGRPVWHYFRHIWQCGGLFPSPVQVCQGHFVAGLCSCSQSAVWRSFWQALSCMTGTSCCHCQFLC
jgi:hypothetical protein